MARRAAFGADSQNLMGGDGMRMGHETWFESISGCDERPVYRGKTLRLGEHRLPESIFAA
jgi:hypothetical protein